jgi:A/G-specific adenine glycosylase
MPPHDARTRKRLLSWFDAKKRDLPWRKTTDPYSVLVSEIMLQQTTVEAVRRPYEAFMKRFPAIRSLARAGEDEVLAAWSGLGYYRRARDLHAAVRRIAAEPGGWPRTAARLQTLPGIGPYTAAAVASIAFGEAVPVLDGNVIRVMSRVGEIGGEVHLVSTRRRLLALAAEFVDPKRPGDSNQALMEIGSTVCRPVDPACHACPLALRCGAARGGTQSRYPAPRKRPDPVGERLAVFVVRDRRGRYLLERSAAEGALKGLWGFPMRGPLGETDDPPSGARRIGSARHGIMNRRLVLEIYETAAVPPLAGRRPARRYASASEIEALPRSSIADKVLKQATRAAGVPGGRGDRPRVRDGKSRRGSAPAGPASAPRRGGRGSRRTGPPRESAERG